MTELPSVRVSVTERERALRELSQHFSAGRLALPEFDRRAALAAAADTRADLAPLFADLPAPEAPPPAPHAQGNPLPAAAASVAAVVVLAIVLATVFGSAYWLLLVLFAAPPVVALITRLRQRDDPARL
ncbi:DUF1707 domain-containing protein [Nocardia aurantia]|uniref:DUF1707 domain-containing protein n=1 Tax=Nocardia aurantia TaxID=2585199 RepID=A0A7K0DR52_9NOCA|nr:DUF1707 domain-containing protein [Nocardia aurantia]MQY28255.1 hypothetical protein [Nocardia aurantia]